MSDNTVYIDAIWNAKYCIYSIYIGCESNLKKKIFNLLKNLMV